MHVGCGDDGPDDDVTPAPDPNAGNGTDPDGPSPAPSPIPGPSPGPNPGPAPGPTPDPFDPLRFEQIFLTSFSEKQLKIIFLISMNNSMFDQIVVVPVGTAVSGILPVDSVAQKFPKDSTGFQSTIF